MEGIFEIKLKVPSYLLDLKRQLSPMAIAELMQEIAGAHAHAFGFGYHQLVPQNLGWLLTALRFQIHEQVLWEQEVILKTWVVGHQRFLSRRDFQFVDAQSGELLISASTQWMLFNFSTHRPVNVETLNPQVAMLGDKKAIEADFEPSKMTFKSPNPFETRITTLDIDMMGHLNNTRYIHFILASYSSAFYLQHRLTSLEIFFRQEIKPESHIQVHQVEIDSLIYGHEITVNQEDKSKCLAILKWNQIPMSDLKN